MDYKQLIQEVQTKLDMAMAYNNISDAAYYQEELNKLRNEEIDKINMYVNPPMYILPKTYTIDPAQLTPSPGAMITWTTNHLELVMDEDSAIKAQKELDQRRNLKLFIHFSKLFCERYPNWTLTPDPNNPFKGVALSHKNNKYKIESAYPDDAIKVIGIDTNQAREDLNFRRRRGIPNAIFRPAHETVPTYTFFGWAIGMDDTPEWVKE